MSGKRARQLRARERGRQDQAVTGARNYGASNPRSAVMTLAYADPGNRCCWCDCPDDPSSPHYSGDATYVCAGCPTDALYVLHAWHGTPEQVNYPMCERHQRNLSAMMAQYTRQAVGPVPTEVHVMSVLADEDDVIR